MKGGGRAVLHRQDENPCGAPARKQFGAELFQCCAELCVFVRRKAAGGNRAADVGLRHRLPAKKENEMISLERMLKIWERYNGFYLDGL